MWCQIVLCTKPYIIEIRNHIAQNKMKKKKPRSAVFIIEKFNQSFFNMFLKYYKNYMTFILIVYLMSFWGHMFSCYFRFLREKKNRRAGTQQMRWEPGLLGECFCLTDPILLVKQETQSYINRKVYIDGKTRLKEAI